MCGLESKQKTKRPKNILSNASITKVYSFHGDYSKIEDLF